MIQPHFADVGIGWAQPDIRISDCGPVMKVNEVKMRFLLIRRY